jgi:hypothetical protein
MVVQGIVTECHQLRKARDGLEHRQSFGVTEMHFLEPVVKHNVESLMSRDLRRGNPGSLEWARDDCVEAYGLHSHADLNCLAGSEVVERDVGMPHELVVNICRRLSMTNQVEVGRCAGLVAEPGEETRLRINQDHVVYFPD